MERLMDVYKKIVNVICFIFESLAILSIVAMLVVVLIHITMRYFFNAAPGWTEEMARQFLILFCFIGFAVGVKDKIHIALSFVAEGALKKILLPLEIIGKVLIVILGLLMGGFMGPYFTLLKYNRLPGTGIPVGYQYIFPALVGFLIAALALYQIYDHFKYGTDEQQKKRKAEMLQKQHAEINKGVLK